MISSGTADVVAEQNITLRNLNEFVVSGVVQPLLEESFFVYSQPDHLGVEQFGVLAAIDVDDCRNNVVKRHEHITKQKHDVAGRKSLV